MKKLIIQFVMILLGLFSLIQSQNISTIGFKADILNQKYYVVVLSILLILTSIGSLISEYLRRAKQTSKDSEVEEVQRKNIDNKKSRRNVYITMLLVLLFAYGFTYIGFFVTAFVFVFIFTWLMFDWDKKKWISSLIFSISMNLALYFLFDMISVYFPKALLF